jgi:hypothetical protein
MSFHLCPLHTVVLCREGWFHSPWQSQCPLTHNKKMHRLSMAQGFVGHAHSLPFWFFLLSHSPHCHQLSVSPLPDITLSSHCWSFCRERSSHIYLPASHHLLPCLWVDVIFPQEPPWLPNPEHQTTQNPSFSPSSLWFHVSMCGSSIFYSLLSLGSGISSILEHALKGNKFPDVSCFVSALKCCVAPHR